MKEINCPSCQRAMALGNHQEWWCAHCKASLAQIIVRDRLVLMVNIDHVPGRQIKEVLGMVAGVDVHGATAFAFTVTSNIESLVEATGRMVTNAYLLGANAVIGTQIIAHHGKPDSITCIGTAVIIE